MSFIGNVLWFLFGGLWSFLGYTIGGIALCLTSSLCGSQEKLKRKVVKALIKTLEEDFPKCRESMLAGLTRVHSTHLLDSDLWTALGIDLGDLLAPSGRRRLMVAG